MLPYFESILVDYCHSPSSGVSWCFGRCNQRSSRGISAGLKGREVASSYWIAGESEGSYKTISSRKAIHPSLFTSEFHARAEFDKHIPFDIYPIKCNITQFIYFWNTVLHVSGDIATHHQEHTQLYLLTSATAPQQINSSHTTLKPVPQ